MADGWRRLSTELSGVGQGRSDGWYISIYTPPKKNKQTKQKFLATPVALVRNGCGIQDTHTSLTTRQVQKASKQLQLHVQHIAVK